MGVPDKIKNWLNNKKIRNVGVGDNKVFLQFMDGSSIGFKAELVQYEVAEIEVEFSDADWEYEMEWSE